MFLQSNWTFGRGSSQDDPPLLPEGQALASHPHVALLHDVHRRRRGVVIDDGRNCGAGDGDTRSRDEDGDGRNDEDVSW